MKYLTLVVALAFVYLTSDADGLLCLPCHEVNCTKAECDNSGYTLDNCVCCTVCAKEFNQTCGGLWNTDGTCDKNLTCDSAYEYDMAYENLFTGRCSDAECEAVVDFVFAFEGSFAFGKDGFMNATIWAQEIIRRIYEMYGACAHVEVMEYAGSGAMTTSLYPMTLNLCTNNNDCIEEKIKNMTLLNLPGIMTFSALFEILDGRFPMSSRRGRSQKVIIVTTYGDTTDSILAENWLKASSEQKVITYATRVGATWEELVNITGTMDRLIDTSDVDDFIDQIWRDTVFVSDECPPEEVYKECSSACEPTCEDPTPVCIERCMPGKCQCMDGYVRENGECIPISECPKTGNCSYGEMFMECSSTCTPTCDDPYPACTEDCGPPRCQCKRGYVMYNGSCMPLEYCPTHECLPGEIYKECSSACEPTCEDPYPTCIERCMPGKCQCMYGYVREEGGECIPISKCPKAGNCSYGEMFMECSSTCTPTCDDPYPACTEDCGPPRCQCKRGYVMYHGSCMPLEYCPTPVICDYPKVGQVCASKCQATCDNPNPWDCDLGCSKDPCVCPVDHVLYSETDRRCVHQYECPVKKCMIECPKIELGVTMREAIAAWVCHFKNWRCTSYQWKISIEEWWYSAGCYAVGGDVESKWRRLFECPEHVDITCINPSQYVYDVDAFGCGMGSCQDGGYRNGTQLMKLWFAHQMKYQEKLQLYNEATTMCQRNFNTP